MIKSVPLEWMHGIVWPRLNMSQLPTRTLKYTGWFFLGGGFQRFYSSYKLYYTYIHSPYIMCMFCILFKLSPFELVKSPDMTLCGWLGYKPSINNNNNGNVWKAKSWTFRFTHAHVELSTVTALSLVQRGVACATAPINIGHALQPLRWEKQRLDRMTRSPSWLLSFHRCSDWSNGVRRAFHIAALIG